MIPLASLLVFFFLFILQTSIFRMFSATAPDIPLLAAVFFGLRYRRYGGLQTGIGAGILQDVSSYGLIGINLLSKGLIGIGTGWLMEKHFLEWGAALTWVLVITAGTVANETISASYMSGIFETPVYFWGFFWDNIRQAFLNVATGIPLFTFLVFLEGWMRKRFRIRER